MTQPFAATVSSAFRISTESSCTRRFSASSAAGSRAIRPSISARSGRPDALAAAASGFGPAGRDGVRLMLELVGERLQLRRLTEPMGQRLRKKPIGEPGVARQQRTVQVGADRAADATTLPAALAVVADPGDHPTQRLRPAVEARATRVILEARKCPARAGLELALEQHVADHPCLARHGVEWKEPDPGQVLAVEVAIGPPEQLVAAADGEQCRALRHRLDHPLRLGRKVLRNEGLLAVLAAADVEEVVLAWTHGLVDRDRPHLELVPAPGGPARKDGDIASIRVDVEVVRIEVSDHDLHAARSQ